MRKHTKLALINLATVVLKEFIKAELRGDTTFFITLLSIIIGIDFHWFVWMCVEIYGSFGF
jgi:hypothetical protein